MLPRDLCALHAAAAAGRDSSLSNTALASSCPRHVPNRLPAAPAAVLEPLWLGLPPSTWPAALMCIAAVAVRGPHVYHLPHQ